MPIAKGAPSAMRSSRWARTRAALLSTTAVLLISGAAAAEQVASTGGIAPQVAQSSIGTIPFDVAPQPLDAALAAFGAASGVQVLYESGVTAGLRSPGLAGTFAPDEALRRLLAGTGLTFRFSNARTVTVERGAAETGGHKADARSPVQLEGLKVSGEWLGEGSEEDVKTYPGGRSVLTQEEIRGSGARDIDDAMRQVPGVRVHDETGTGILPNIGMRGLSPLRSERTLVLVDGIPAALAPYTHTGMSLFPVTFETVERIDVVRGGAAVHYGPNNVGGVVNIITKPISKTPSATAKQQLSIADGTGNVLSDSYARVGGFVTPDFGIQAQANLVAGAANRDHSNTDVYNVIVNTEKYIGNDDTLKTTLQLYQAEAELPGALSAAAYDQDRTQSQRPHDKFEGRTIRGDVKWNHLFSDASELEWTTFGHISDRRFTWGKTMNPALTSTVESTSPRDFKVVGTEPRQSWSFKTGPVDQKVTVGGRYVHEDTDYVVDERTLSTGSSARTRDWHFDTNAYAGYVSDTLGFMNSRLEVTPGLRYEFVDTNFDDRRLNSPGGNVTKELLPGIAVGLKASDEVFLFTNAQKSLRPPQVSQVTKQSAVGNEVAWNYEIGTRLTPTKSFDATLTWFRINFENQIEYVSTTQIYRNTGETRHDGVEIETNWRPEMVPGLALKAGYTYLDAEQLSGTYAGRDVAYSIKHQLNLGASYKVDGYAFGVDGYYYSAAFSDSANTEPESSTGSVGQIPAYWLWNAQVSKDFSVDGRDLTAVAAINNVFDADYFFRGVDVSDTGRVPGPGRTFILSLKADF